MRADVQLAETGHAGRFQPHDLLWIRNRHALVSAVALPDWVGAGRLADSPVVVRREQLADPLLVPVGLRGETRAQRLRCYVRWDAVLRLMRPEELLSDAVWQNRIALPRFQVVVALDALAPLLDATGLCWGPTGSMGFSLAIGMPVIHADSDLDLVVRAPNRLTAAQAQLLHAVIEQAPCRVDMQIDTGHGGFSFAEWIRAKGVLLKTGTGPMLTNDPWQQVVERSA
jgi:phosphoribosyl-dephospho-CoA transferase